MYTAGTLRDGSGDVTKAIEQNIDIIKELVGMKSEELVHGEWYWNTALSERVCFISLHPSRKDQVVVHYDNDGDPSLHCLSNLEPLPKPKKKVKLYAFMSHLDKGAPGENRVYLATRESTGQVRSGIRVPYLDGEIEVDEDS